MSEMFPAIAIDGELVKSEKYVESGTGRAVFGAFFVAILGTLIGILATYGVLLLVLLLSPLFAWFFRAKAMALIHGSGVHVGPDQFPEIHACVTQFRKRLGIAKDVEVYIVEANIANAAAVKYGKKNVILLTDDLIHGCLASGQPHALAFVIAHELAHISLKHTGVVRSWMSQHMKKLGRLDEYSADAVAAVLVGQKGIAFQGLLLLTVGYALMPYVNIESIGRQAQEVEKNKYSKKAEYALSHPLLMNRIIRILRMP